MMSPDHKTPRNDQGGSPALTEKMIRFAFLGRVSTEDNQDPVASRAWQRSRACALVEPRGGLIVEEYFDIDKSRSIPWPRRPYASALLAELRNPARNFNAVVIGEPQRAFYGNQYGLTFPLFEHFQVPLWVPEVGGPIDPDNEAHDMIMGVFGGLSKGERNRIKVRVRATMGAITATEGRFLGGRPPYGYDLADAGPHPNPAKAADGKRLRCLVVNPITGSVVQFIFAKFLDGWGIHAIAEELTAKGVPSPSASDPGRNKHRNQFAWSKSAIRVILTNPRYTGRQVWNKQRKDEVLIDVNDVALGTITKQRWNPKNEWIWSEEEVHEALISTETFDRAQVVLAGRGRGAGELRRRQARHPYMFRGVLFCGYCQRRMQGNWSHGAVFYRCRYPQEYALANQVDHPRNINLKEAEFADKIEEWLLASFGPEKVPEMIRALESVADTSVLSVKQDTSARLAECNRKLARYRAALDGGGDIKTITAWINEVDRERTLIAAEAAQTPRTTEIQHGQIATLIEKVGGLVGAVMSAEPEDKADLFKELGLKMTYWPNKQLVEARLAPAPTWVNGLCPRSD